MEPQKRPAEDQLTPLHAQCDTLAYPDKFETADAETLASRRIVRARIEIPESQAAIASNSYGSHVHSTVNGSQSQHEDSEHSTMPNSTQQSSKSTHQPFKSTVISSKIGFSSFGSNPFSRSNLPSSPKSPSANPKPNPFMTLKPEPTVVAKPSEVKIEEKAEEDEEIVTISSNGEENEIKLYETRTRVFRLVKETDSDDKVTSSEWRQIGLGPVRFLSSGSSVRMVARQESKVGGNGTRVVVNLSTVGAIADVQQGKNLVVKSSSNCYLFKFSSSEEASKAASFFSHT